LEYLGLHNKPKAEVHPGHKLMGPKEEGDMFCTYQNTAHFNNCAFVGINHQ
jgi:hypothetical protein